jgi:hypothetical protein
MISERMTPNYLDEFEISSIEDILAKIFLNDSLWLQYIHIGMIVENQLEEYYDFLFYDSGYCSELLFYKFSIILCSLPLISMAIE